MFGAGVALFGLAYLAFAMTPGILLLAFAFLAAGVGIGAVETAEHAAVASLAPAELRGSAFGLLAAIQSVGDFLASVAVGLIWTLVSPAAGFGVAAIAMGAALLVLAFTRRHRGH